jgi:regulator of sigma D
MTGELEIIEQVIAQHQIIRMNLRGAQNFLADLDALFSVQKAQAGWAQSSVEKLQEQKQQLQDAFSRVKTGLDGHFAYEERVLPPLLGEALAKALILIHNEIRQQLDKTMAMVNRTGFNNPNQKETLAAKQRIQNETNSLTRMIEDHATTEERMLLMLKKAFQN